jgi:hypothetical protein
MTKKTASETPLRLIKWCAQWQEMKKYEKVPLNLRRIYVLHKFKPGGGSDCYNVVYVGMATSGIGIKRRLRTHARSKRKRNKWSHFSFFVVWENIRNDEISELERLFREIYRKDDRANSLNKQKGSTKLRGIRRQAPKDWADQ